MSVAVVYATQGEAQAATTGAITSGAQELGTTTGKTAGTFSYLSTYFPTVPLHSTDTVAGAGINYASPTTSIDALVEAVKAANPATMGTGTNAISSSTMTTANTTWNQSSNPTETPDLTAVVNELTGQGGWAFGNAMCFVLADQSAGADSAIWNSGTPYLFVMYSGSSYDTIVSGDSPVGWWKLADASGSSSAADASGNSRTLTTLTGGVTFQEAGLPSNSSDKSALFSSGSAHASLSFATSTWTGFSAEIWFNDNGTAITASGGAMGIEITSSATTTGWILSVNASGEASARVSNGTTAPTSSSTTAPFATAGSGWHHMAVTWDFTNQYLYLDGQLVATTANSGSAVPAISATAFYLGRNPVGNYLSGLLAQAACYGYTLTPAQIQAHYAAGISTFVTPANCSEAEYQAQGTGTSGSSVLINLGSPAADTALVSDSVKRVTKVSLSLSDTASASDSPARTARSARSVSDTAAAGDAVTPHSVLSRGLTDAATTSEAPTSLLADLRTVSEAATVSDSPSRGTDAFRVLSESAVASDVASRLLFESRSASETATASDRSSESLTVSIADAATASDSPTSGLTLGASAAETITASDAVLRLLAVMRSVSDTAMTSDRVASSLTVAITDSATVSDSTSTRLVTAHATSDSVTTSDAVTRLEQLSHQAAEAAVASDSISPHVVVSRIVSDVALASDVVRGNRFVQSTTDTVAVSDSVRALVLTGPSPYVVQASVRPRSVTACVRSRSVSATIRVRTVEAGNR